MDQQARKRTPQKVMHGRRNQDCTPQGGEQGIGKQEKQHNHLEQRRTGDRDHCTARAQAAASQSKKNARDRLIELLGLLDL